MSLKTKIDWESHPQLIKQIWREVGKLEKFKWSLPKPETLSFLEKKIVEEIYSIEDSAQANRRLREILGPRLNRFQMPKEEQGETFFITRSKLARWIIVDWGKIKKGKDKIAGWMDNMPHFDDEYVYPFISKMRNQRVSSWSKLLSFANYKKYPIYDARATVALNIALNKTSVISRFEMPNTQNKKIPKAIDKIVSARKSLPKNKQWAWLEYEDYFSLLHSIVKHADVQDVLEAEMTLFARAPQLAKEFCEDEQ